MKTNIEISVQLRDTLQGALNNNIKDDEGGSKYWISLVDLEGVELWCTNPDKEDRDSNPSIEIEYMELDGTTTIDQVVAHFNEAIKRQESVII